MTVRGADFGLVGTNGNCSTFIGSVGWALGVARWRGLATVANLIRSLVAGSGQRSVGQLEVLPLSLSFQLDVFVCLNSVAMNWLFACFYRRKAPSALETGRIPEKQSLPSTNGLDIQLLPDSKATANLARGSHG